jgi:hypothetical protein
MLNVPVVLLVAAVAVLAGIIAVAVGRGGELAFFRADYAPLKLDEVAATDVVLFRPPMALWGYSVQATDEALNRIAEALTERDIEITALRQQVANLEASSPPLRRRVHGVLGRKDRADRPMPPVSGRPAASRDERPSGPLPRVAPPSGASGSGARSSGPLPPVAPLPGASGSGARSSGPLPPVAPPPGPPGPGTRDAGNPEAGGDGAARPAASGAREAERYGLGGTAAPGHQPTAAPGHQPTAATEQPSASAEGEDER